MQDDRHDLDYPSSAFLTIRHTSLQIVDTVLLAALGRMWEQMRDLVPSGRASAQTWSYSPEDLRTSRLGQALLTIADYADGGFVTAAKVERAMKRAYRMLFGDSLADDYSIPQAFHTTDLGALFHAASARLYRREDLLTPKQAYDLLGVARQTLYNRLSKGRLTPVYLHGDLRFLRAEIEEWKTQREQRGRTSKPEE
jgi:predicted DNA-binding transcriptional regulator AlpA